MLVDVFGSRQIEEDTESLQDIAAEMAPTRVLSPTAWNKPSTEANHTGNLKWHKSHQLQLAARFSRTDAWLLMITQKAQFLMQKDWNWANIIKLCRELEASPEYTPQNTLQELTNSSFSRINISNKKKNLQQNCLPSFETHFHLLNFSAADGVYLESKIRIFDFMRLME